MGSKGIGSPVARTNFPCTNLYTGVPVDSEKATGSLNIFRTAKFAFSGVVTLVS